MHAFLVLAIACVVPAVIVDAPPPEQAASGPTGKVACQDHAVVAAANGKAIGIRPLGQEPDVRQLLAVVRTIDGCSKPVVVNDRVGFKGR